VTRRAHHSGLTLTELLIVVALIGILAALSLSVVQSLRGRMYFTRCLSNVRTIGAGFVQMVDALPADEEALKVHFPVEPSWWRSRLSGYGVRDEHWVCPASAHESETPEEWHAHYQYVGVKPWDAKYSPFRSSYYAFFESGAGHRELRMYVRADGSAGFLDMRAL
jgi:prepilin-type N-terminal cleavage/methylation domain-containing protein